MSKKIKTQLNFINELEKLKLVTRMNGVLGGIRAENSAEHSWHVCLVALVLIEYCELEVDLLRVLKMLLIHDVVEIDAGDTWVFDENKNETKFDLELTAAKRIFGILPAPQSEDYQELWLEFENQATNEAKYARAIDALHPVINHLLTGKKEEGVEIAAQRVLSKKEFIKEVSEPLWELTKELVEESKRKGLYL